MRRSALAFIMTTGLCAAGAQSGMAADLPVKAPIAAPAAAYNWSGCYVGGQLGGTWGRSEHVETASGSSITGRFDISGIVLGGTLGCNYQTGPWVFGLEGDGAWTGAQGGTFDIPPFNTNFFARTREEWLATVRGRIGYASSNWLFYATGGGAFADVKVSAYNTASTTSAADETRTLTGWTVGGGFEFLLGGPWTAKVEYLYVDFGSNQYFNPAPACCVTRDVDLYQHIARVGLNYKFGGVGPVTAKY